MILIRIGLLLFHPNKGFVLFRINRFGSIIFIFLALLVAAGLKGLLQLRAKKVIYVIMGSILLAGYCSLFYHLDNWGNAKFERAFKIFKKDYFPPGVHNSERIRFLIEDRRKSIMTPPSVSKAVARNTGLDVPYIEQPRNKFKNFFSETITQDERLQNVEIFYNELNRGNLQFDILSRFNANCFLAQQKGLEKEFDIIYLGPIKINKNSKWHLYQLI